MENLFNAITIQFFLSKKISWYIVNAQKKAFILPISKSIVMKTVIFPVEFSEVAINAAVYGVKLLTVSPETEIILYHVYNKPGEHDEAMEKLQGLKDQLLKNRQAKITLIAESGDLTTELEKLARHRDADMIVMGLTDRNPVMKLIKGNNALKMVENKYCPVMIIPENAVYSEVKNVLLASDLKNTVSTTPSALIKKILDTFKAKLHVVNVNSEHYIEISEEYAAEQKKMSEMFEGYDPEFYFLRLYDINEAIKVFAEDKKIDLIITIHKEYSLMHNLFSSADIKKLAHESHVPVVTTHE